uniref:COMM domain containing 4 n=1 Tax=Pipistrellus kuhlii TaxID=59472 RepID=A0A7J8AZT5_PIPKU|nr:COMM domain containing 4 [Pipistrellus kuhlii]
MRFRFCGDLDCPDWVLAEISTLAKIYEKVQKLTADARFVNRLAGTGWRVDYIMSSSLLQPVEEPVVHLRLEVATAPEAPAQPVALSLSADKFQVLLAELKQAQALMSSLG